MTKHSLNFHGLRVLLGISLYLLIAPGLAEQTIDQTLEKAARLVVAVDSKFGNQNYFGAGLIISHDSDGLLIVTANHVVRHGEIEAKDIEIKVRSSPEKSHAGVLEKEFDSEIDLAVLRVDLDEDTILSPCDLPLETMFEEIPSKRGHGVFPIGNPNGVAWQFPVAPDQVTEVNQNDIIFQSAVIENGHSGGGLFNIFGDPIGMIKADQPPYGVATRLTKILERLRHWGYLAADSQRSLGDLDDANRPCQNGSRQTETTINPAIESKAAENRRRIQDWAKEQLNQLDQNSSQDCVLEEAHDHWKGETRLLGRYFFKCPNDPPAQIGRITESEVAVRRGDIKQLERLAKSKDFLREKYYSLLHWAILADKPDSVKFLLLNGASVNTSSGVYSPYIVNGNRHVSTPINLATALERFDIVKMLIDNGAAIDEGHDMFHRFGGSPITLAASLGFIDAVKMLLKAGVKSGPKAVEEAVTNGHIDIVRLLRKTGGANSSSSDVALLARAAVAEQIETLKYLLDSGATVKCEYSNHTGMLLDPNCKNPLDDVVRHYFITRTYSLDGGITVRQASKPKLLEAIKLLLQSGVDSTPYLRQALDDRRLLELFLKAGADPNHQENGKSVLRHAIENGNSEAARTLRAYGATK